MIGLLVTLASLFVLSLVALGICISKLESAQTRLMWQYEELQAERTNVKTLREESKRKTQELNQLYQNLDPQVVAAVDDLEDWIEEYSDQEA